MSQDPLKRPQSDDSHTKATSQTMSVTKGILLALLIIGGLFSVGQFLIEASQPSDLERQFGESADKIEESVRRIEEAEKRAKESERKAPAPSTQP